MKNIKIAREIIKCYLSEKEEIKEIAMLLSEEADEKYTYLKEYITVIRDIMNKALKEINKNEK